MDSRLPKRKRRSQSPRRRSQSPRRRSQSPRRSNERSKSPKRKVNKFIRFYNEIRPELMENYPGCRVYEYAQMAGSMWRELSSAEKNTY